MVIVGGPKIMAANKWFCIESAVDSAFTRNTLSRIAAGMDSRVIWKKKKRPSDWNPSIKIVRNSAIFNLLRSAFTPTHSHSTHMHYVRYCGYDPNRLGSGKNFPFAQSRIFIEFNPPHIRPAKIGNICARSNEQVHTEYACFAPTKNTRPNARIASLPFFPRFYLIAAAVLPRSSASGSFRFE